MNINEDILTDEGKIIYDLTNILIDKNKKIEQLNKKNKALLLLLNWAEECDWGFDNFRDDDVIDWDNFEKETEDLDYIESMVKYAEMYLESRGE